MKFQQLRWAAGMGDKTQPPTSIVVKTVCTNFLEWPGGHSDKARCRKSCPLDRGRELEARFPVQWFFLYSFYRFVWLSFISQVVFLSFCKLMGLCFHFFFLFKLIEWCFTFENLFEVVNFYSDNFLLTAGDLRDCCLFQFYQSYKFYQFYQQIIFLICLFVCVVLFLAQRKICLGLLKKGKLCKEKRGRNKLPVESFLI